MLYLALNYLRIGILNELQYRVNFFVQMGQSLVSLGTGLIGLWLVFSHTEELNGWTRPELLAVMGIHILMGGVIQAAIQPNMGRLMEEIQMGTLDYALTKPVDAQALVSMREFRLWQLTDVLVGLIVLFVAVYQYQGSVGVWQSLAFMAALAMGSSAGVLLLADAHLHRLLDRTGGRDGQPVPGSVRCRALPGEHLPRAGCAPG